MNSAPPIAKLRENSIDAIVVGGSAGCIDVLRTLLASLPRLAIPVIIVVHLPPRGPGVLHEALASPSSCPIKQAEDKEPVMGGIAYCAPPGYHLLVETDRSFALSMDDPVHFSRPSIDVLFESACDAYDGKLLALLLSGASNDGASGLHTIHRAGGVTIVQSPESAEAAAMPKSALALFQPTFTLTPPAMAQLISSTSRYASIRS